MTLVKEVVVPGLEQCVNPVVTAGDYYTGGGDDSDGGSGGPVDPARWRLLHATVFQRHLDRWM